MDQVDDLLTDLCNLGLVLEQVLPDWRDLDEVALPAVEVEAGVVEVTGVVPAAVLSGEAGVVEVVSTVVAGGRSRASFVTDHDQQVLATLQVT